MGKLTTIIKAIWAFIALLKEIKTIYAFFKNIPWKKIKERFSKRKVKDEEIESSNDNVDNSNSSTD